ncbi:GL14616 [Drosophila persimilis]|uniref:GL14616 n=1 Tax=Drosophila persimilis TaxID=7234 RepID=B4GVR8_DROPE|nr:GL14616 [Drosophila persimilis]
MHANCNKDNAKLSKDHRKQDGVDEDENENENVGEGEDEDDNKVARAIPQMYEEAGDAHALVPLDKLVK